MSRDETKEIRVLLLGKTGAGKSSLGNTLLGRDVFEVGKGLSSGTEKCQCADITVGGLILQVTDTPGLCDTHRSEEEVLREIAKCCGCGAWSPRGDHSVAVAEPGPHVVIIVLRCDKRFTSEEYAAYCTLKGMFGDDLCKHLILVFVGIDSTTRVPGERQTELKKLIGNSPPPTLQEAISDCCGRYFAVDNTSSAEDRSQQARGLLSRIQELIKQNDGRYFSNKLCEDVAKDVEPLIESRMQEDHVTRADAARAVREDIVEENIVEALQRWVLEVRDALQPTIVQVCVEMVQKGLEKIQVSQCSVM